MGNKTIVKFKIKGLPSDKEFASMPFGRQIEHSRAIALFKESCKSIHLSQKRQTAAKAIKEAVALYGATEYFCQYHDDCLCRDDTFEFWYR